MSTAYQKIRGALRINTQIQVPEQKLMSLVSAPTISPEEPVLTPILAIGNKDDQAGFSLIEVLVVLLILSITFGMLSVSFFNTEQTHWKDMNRRLLVSLNHGKDETTLSGAPIVFQIDKKGWRFLAPNLKDEFYVLGDALSPYVWKTQTNVEGITQFQLDEAGSTSPVVFKIIQGSLTATIHRRRDGYFEIR
jgi:type II secretion system protein H